MAKIEWTIDPQFFEEELRIFFDELTTNGTDEQLDCIHWNKGVDLASVGAACAHSLDKIKRCLRDDKDVEDSCRRGRSEQDLHLVHWHKDAGVYEFFIQDADTKLSIAARIVPPAREGLRAEGEVLSIRFVCRNQLVGNSTTLAGLSKVQSF